MAEVDDTKGSASDSAKDSAMLNTRNGEGINTAETSFQYCYIQSEEYNMFLQ